VPSVERAEFNDRDDRGAIVVRLLEKRHHPTLAHNGKRDVIASVITACDTISRAALELQSSNTPRVHHERGCCTGIAFQCDQRRRIENRTLI